MGKSRGRASSSGVPVVGFGGYHGASRVEPAADSDGSVRLPPDVDAEVLQHLRRLGRKDPTTKLKALSTLSMLFAQKPGEEVVQIVPQWAFEYKRLLLDYNRDVRRATNDTMASLVSAVKKGLAPHLKSLMGPWWFSQFDPATEVAQAGRRSFEAAFPQSDRRMDALMLCVKETFLYLNENLKLTTQALSDKVTPMDELEDMHERVISSSLLAMATLIDILLGVKLQSDGGDSMNTESKSHSKVRSATLSSAEAALSMHKYFINFLRSKSAVIRSATYTLLTSYVKYVPNVFNEEAMKILSSTLLGAFSEKSYVEPYLSLFDADFVPWCLDGKYSTCSSKIDLLLSLIQEECFFDQWCLIIKQTRAKEKQSVDHKISHTKDQFELLTLILQKVRERIAGGKMKNLQRSGSLPEHWRHDLLDSVAVSVFCDLPATDSHVHFLCAALGGSSQDDQICFLSAEAVCKIRGSILKSLASVLITSTFEWTKSSRFLLLPMEHEHSKILGEQSLSANLEIAQLAFQVLERSLFALNTHEEYSVFSHILSALFIIEWECSMALVLAEESDLKGHKEEINVEALMCNTSDDHLDETVHLKANLAERIHAFRQSLIPSFWNDLHSGTLNKLVNILAQSVRYAVFDTVDLPIDRTAVLCSEWVVDMLRLICLDHIKLQSFFDALLSEGEYWPLWVKPSLQNGHASVKIQREPLTTDGTELKHQRFVAFVDKLVLNLSFGEVILAPLSSFSRAWVAAEMICTWNWKGGSAFSTFLPSLVQYMKTEPGLEVSFVSLLLDTLLEGALMHESSDWALFNSWHLSDSEIEKIQDRFLRSLVALLFTAYTKESVLRESDAHVLFEQLRSSLLIGSAVNRKCLRTLPFVMSTIIKPLTEKVRLNEASPCTDLLGKSILSWLEEAISSLSSSPREVAQQDIEDWMQVVLSCFPLKITGGTSKLIVKFEREISDAETSLLLTLFSRYQTFYGSADPSLSSRETILSKTVELLGVKLTAVMVGYCWTKLGETDWCFVFHILRKWIESSVLLVEEMTDNINDAAVNQTSAQDILEKLKLIACTMEDLTFTFAESALVTLCHLNLVDNLHETDNSPNLQLIRSGEYAESNDKMMENILRLFLASGVSEAIAGSCSEEASSIIASSRVDHLHFWELVASFIIDASPQIRRSALDSMKLWGLTKEPVNGLYSILFSSEPISHLQFAAYSLLMSEPLCQLSLVKGSSVGEIGEIPLSSQESEVGQNIESIPDSEKALYLRDELTALIEMPTSELVKTDLVALERVNVFVAWALVLSHLQLLPLSSATREKVLQYVQDKISPSILDCIFQHIPLKTAAPSGKKKDVELMPEARAAAEASKGAITTCSLLPYVESLWPVGVLQMASLAGSLYGMMIRLLPSYVRTWFTSLRDRSLSYSIESFTRAWCSPPLLLDEFSQQRIEKSVECSRRMQNIELQKRIDNLEQVLEKQAIQMKNICQQHENDKKRWETERKNTFTTIEALVAECEGLKIKYNEEMAEKKKLHNIVQELKGNIRVFCRCRPLSKLEASLGFKTAVDFDGADDGELRIIEGKSRRLFKFDRVYAPDDDQAKVFSDASSLVTSVLDGYNVCILAYGQTGTGKTFTMEGTEQNRGVNYRTLRELFSLTDNKKQLFQYNIYVSMLEVYNENIRDLLSPSMASPTKLEIKTASDGSHYIRGIAEREVDNIDDAWDILLSGSNSRAVGSTDVNEHSSRSHSMLCITVSANNLINNVCTKSKLWLVDLAGSERNAKTGAQGDRLEEAKNINRSLSALGNVIAALASGHSHIPYRDSKLTYLLQDFLGGDSKALLLVQISPSDNDLAETIDTLKFAERAMGVELGPAKRQKGYLAVRGGGVHEAGLGAAATPGADAGRHASAAGRHHGPLSEAFHRRRQGLAAAGN
ncbi:E3 ubiquitin-protein ligase listerin isoform X5 [Lolium perenne]|uniref:E3 ubiquitin-protein ligase listerin isoform X5 n=1 Tax=Lolium perenne TaxID=4522 RepID=UPI0021F5CC0E|nr:E3 ubiquitin-protein ligase listerin-like isoform X6 [Lolium perenne]